MSSVTELQKGSIIYGDVPSLNDFTRGSVFDRERNPGAFHVAGPESVNISQIRPEGPDLSVVAPGNVPLVDTQVWFWDRIELPVSPNICVGINRAMRPKGYRLNLGAYDDRFNTDGQYDAWRDLLNLTLTKGDFGNYCAENGFGDLIPKTFRFKSANELTRQKIREIFALAKKWWVKPEKEILAVHKNYPVTNAEELAEAVERMDGAAFIIQMHVAGDSFAIGYEITESGLILPTYCGKELVTNGFQWGVEQRPEYNRLRARFTDALTQHFADRGFRGPISWGLMYDESNDTVATFGDTGAGFVNDNNMRAGGGQTVDQLGAKATKLGGMPLDVRAEFHYEYLDGIHSGEELLRRIEDSRSFRPDPATGTGFWPVGIRPDGGGKFAVFGKDARVRFQDAKKWFGLYVPEH